MSIIKKIVDFIYYYIDNIKVKRLKVKIEHFIHNHTHNQTIVVYRLGRQKLLNKMYLTQFEKEYFEQVSNYDQHRLTKFSTLQHILQNLFAHDICSKEHFSRFIEDNIKYEQLL